MPLILNKQAYEAIEIASFNNFKIDFIKKLAESIAATVSMVKINEKTKKLLAESQL